MSLIDELVRKTSKLAKEWKTRWKSICDLSEEELRETVSKELREKFEYELEDFIKRTGEAKPYSENLSNMALECLMKIRASLGKITKPDFEVGLEINKRKVILGDLVRAHLSITNKTSRNLEVYIAINHSDNLSLENNLPERASLNPGQKLKFELVLRAIKEGAASLGPIIVEARWGAIKTIKETPSYDIKVLRLKHVAKGMLIRDMLLTLILTLLLTILVWPLPTYFSGLQLFRVILPISVLTLGVTISMYKYHFKLRESRSELESLIPEVLKTVKEHKGILLLPHLIGESEISLTMAEALLKILKEKGMLEEYEVYGNKVYFFPDYCPYNRELIRQLLKRGGCSKAEDMILELDISLEDLKKSVDKLKREGFVYEKRTALDRWEICIKC
ncbi:MAG: hypothetical protein DRJ41_01740 [Thermoprotei archaeon]|nr:MAG: hypothetical protein DRJ41_01740 [Thermoprotei archaeon]